MHRYIYVIISAVILLMCRTTASAGTDDDGKVHFDYDVDFEMKFDNRELYRSDFSNSMTIFGARLTPSVGIVIPQDELSLNHRIMLGIDVMKDFGASPISPDLAGPGSDEAAGRLTNLDLFREMTLYYKLERNTEKTGLELYAGVFPRKTAEGNYSEAFFSDSLKFYDNNLEGLLIKVRRPRGYWEVGCDWLGQKGQVRKEKFMVFSAGESFVANSLHIGYAAYMYHFAGSTKARGVVDNILLNPYVKFDLGRQMGLQMFEMRLGWLQAMQHDREFVGHYVFPGGGEFDLDVRNWNVGIHNRLFYGTDMMPYYNNVDKGGDKYGTRLYMGDPFYRIHDDGIDGPGLYDRLDLYWEPKLGNMLSLRVSARFHFHDSSYSGCQQIVGLRFNLEEMSRFRRK